MSARYALSALLIAATLGAAPVHAQDVIKIGDLNSYKAMAANMVPYRRGTDLAVEEINAKGGLLGKKLVIVSRDDGANPGDAVRMADELRLNEKVDFLTGTILSHVGVAVADYARQHKVFFLASAPLTDKIVWENGNRYTYRLRATTYSHAAALVPYASGLKLKRWAVVYPNYEYGQSAVATFKELLKKAQPDVEFVAELAPPLGKIDAGAVAEALREAKPDAIFNVLFGADLAKFAREGSTRGLFEKTKVVSLLTGEPEYLDPLKSETPVGWFVTGYPWYAIKTPEHVAFLQSYQKRYGDYPRMASLVGYVTIQALAAGIVKAGSTDSEKLAKAFAGLTFSTPAGDVSFRASDHQSTLGLYVGPLGLKDGNGMMTSYDYLDGSKLLPPDQVVMKLRPVPAQ